MITEIEGIRVGHWTDADAMTGCTVVLFPEGTVASGEVRGGAPATREFALLDPTKMVQRLDAVVLTGGSAFGLAAADGVMAVLAERGQGFETVGGPVPIVVAMGLFDLAVGDGSVRPTAAAGRSATESATTVPPLLGAVGAGTGATVAKWRGPDHRRPGALVSATVRAGDVVVSALVAVNAFGEPGATPAEVLDGTTGDAFQNTTIGVVATNAALDKVGCHLAAQSAHDGLARAVAPSHTSADGDAFVVAATGQVDCEVGLVRTMAIAAVEEAIASLPSIVVDEGRQ
ncbi:P1 family peptidase [Actinospongicola halichondriae]|uniref:P1 family peptidase n=1 Tax=Actinospongicola halichondriae TaxID=3236844 RepID=UPI003D5D007F